MDFKRLYFTLPLMAVVAAGIVVLANAESQPDRETLIAESEALQAGQAVYIEHCAACHGENGEGQSGVRPPNQRMLAPAHDSSGHTWQHSDELLVQQIRDGTPEYGMPGFEPVLTDDDIDAVIAYIKLWWTEDQIEHQKNALYCEINP